MGKRLRTSHSFSGIIMPANTDCPECDYSRCTVTHLFYEDHNKVLDIDVDSDSYIANEADYTVFKCPSCDFYKKI